MPTTRSTFAALFLVPVLGGLASAAESSTTDPYREGLTDPVRKLAIFLKTENNVGEVAIDSIKPKQKGAAPGGESELRSTIRDLLEANKVSVKLDTTKGSMWSIAVTYEAAAIPVGNGATKRPGLKIVLTAYHQDSPKESFEAGVEGVELVAGGLGRSFDVIGAPTTDKVAERVIEVIQKNEEITIKNGKVRAKKENPKETSPYAVEILVENKPVEPRNDSGFAVVALPMEKDFWIRLTNDTDYAAAANVMIDGVSVFAPGADTDGPNKGKPKYSHYIVAAKQTVTVGWHVSADRIDALRVTSFHDSVAAKFDSTRVGPRTVTVVFAAAWEKGQEPAKGEPILSRSGDNGIGIGRGAPSKAETKVVDMTIGSPRAAVTIRYEVERKK